MQAFPQPLSIEEENEYIERWEQGDHGEKKIGPAQGGQKSWGNV